MNNLKYLTHKHDISLYSFRCPLFLLFSADNNYMYFVKTFPNFYECAYIVDYVILNTIFSCYYWYIYIYAHTQSILYIDLKSLNIFKLTY